MRSHFKVVGGSSITALQARFLSIRRRIVIHARIFFRHIACYAKRADAIAETLGLAWMWFVRLAERGKDATQFPAVLASYAARAVKSGRRVCGQLKARDVMSERAQQRRHFVVGKLPDFSTLTSNPLAEALHENSRTAVPEQVTFRLDFPAWLVTRSARDRRLIESMAMGERTMTLARQFGISPSRISQLRRAFHDDWDRFCDTPLSSDD